MSEHLQKISKFSRSKTAARTLQRIDKLKDLPEKTQEILRTAADEIRVLDEMPEIKLKELTDLLSTKILPNYTTHEVRKLAATMLNAPVSQIRDAYQEIMQSRKQARGIDFLLLQLYIKAAGIMTGEIDLDATKYLLNIAVLEAEEDNIMDTFTINITKDEANMC